MHAAIDAAAAAEAGRGDNQGTEAAEAGAGDNQGTAALPEVRRYLKDAVVAAMAAGEPLEAAARRAVLHWRETETEVGRVGLGLGLGLGPCCTGATRRARSLAPPLPLPLPLLLTQTQTLTLTQTLPLPLPLSLHLPLPLPLALTQSKVARTLDAVLVAPPNANTALDQQVGGGVEEQS